MNFLDQANRRHVQGFSLIDVMIAIIIMMVGVLALASALTSNLARSYESEQRIVAKQLALSTIESIISARDIQRIGVIEGWDSIGNVGTNPVNGINRGIFLTGWTPIRAGLGADGVAGTADDACAGTGPCVVSGQPANTSEILQNYERQIVITDVDDPERPHPPNDIARRNITVNIRFIVHGSNRQESFSTIVANY